ncbi:MAG: hypothetical protein EBS53_14995, partial [Bacteroidetes bacterium]|nr:hypothetical protein [Bacteroidota bacterium]
MIASALTSGTAAQLTGGNVLQSAISGAVSGAQKAATAPTPTPTKISETTTDPYTQIQADTTISNILAQARQDASASGELPQEAFAPAVGAAVVGLAESAAAREAALVLARYALPRAVQALEAVAPETAQAIAGSSVFRQLAALLGIAITTGPTAFGPAIGFLNTREDTKAIADALNEQVANPQLSPQEVTNRITVTASRLPPDASTVVETSVVGAPPKGTLTNIPTIKEAQAVPAVAPTIPNQGVVISVDPQTKMATLLTNSGIKLAPATGVMPGETVEWDKLPSSMLPREGYRGPEGEMFNVTITGKVDTKTGKVTVVEQAPEVTGAQPIPAVPTVSPVTGAIQQPQLASLGVATGNVVGTVIDVNTNNNTAFVITNTGALAAIQAKDTATNEILKPGASVSIDTKTGAATSTTTAAQTAAATTPATSSATTTATSPATAATTATTISPEVAASTELQAKPSAVTKTTTKSATTPESAATQKPATPLQPELPPTLPITPEQAPGVPLETPPVVTTPPSDVTKPLKPEGKITDKDVIDLIEKDLAKTPSEELGVIEPTLTEPSTEVPLPEVAVAGETPTQVVTKVVSIPPGQRVTEPASSGI